MTLAAAGGIAPGLVAVFEAGADGTIRTIATGDQASVVLDEDLEPSDLPRLLSEHLEAAFDAHGPIRFETRRTTREGRRTYSVSLVPGVPADGEGDSRRYVAAFASDVTASQRAAEVLEETQRLAHIGHWAWDIVRDDMTWSTELHRIFGVDPERFVPDYENFLDLVHPDDRLRVHADVQVARASKEAYSHQYRITRPDGEDRVVLGRGRVFSDADGLVVRLSGTVQDVTGRRQAEERFERLIRLSPDGVVVVDREGRIVLVNEQTEHMFGYDSGELVGERVEVLLPERFRSAHVRHRDEFHDNPRVRPMGTGLELSGRRRDGTEFPVAISLAPLAGEEGQWVIATVRDVTEAHRARENEQRLREVRQRQEQALELNDNVIQGLSTAWLALENDERDLARHVIERTLDAVRDIVTDLLHANGGSREGPPVLVRATRAPSLAHDVEGDDGEHTDRDPS